MHIAVCDDNGADRKQLERLLSRESDKRMETTGNLYVTSYGNPESLLQNPRQFDVFFIDVCKTVGSSGLLVVKALVEMGIQASYVMCCSDVNYREQDFPEGTYFLDKPILVKELSDILDVTYAKLEGAKSQIELRTKKETIYVHEEDIMYAYEKGLSLFVRLTDERELEISSSASNFFTEVETYPAFLMPNTKTVINCRYIEKIGVFNVTMSDKRAFRIYGDCKEYAKRTLKTL
ncbi:MAG: hypothetical protein IJ608_06990 [Lachnospiraceae bacterium]|nr:hypothetical protein [Lachnospiraceae bacterium]